MNQDIISVPFHNDTLTATLVSGVPHVAIKPICENLGIDWDSQRHRIDRHPVLKATKVIITAVAADGKLREMLMLPINKLNGWLFGIDANRVNKEAQKDVVLYQEKCFDVLADYFMPKEKEKPLFKPQPFTTPLHPTMMTRQMKTHVQNMIDVAIRGKNVTSNKVSIDLASYFYCDSWDLIPMSFYPDICAYFNVESQFEVESTNNWTMIDVSELGDLLNAKIESDRYKEERDTAQLCVQNLYKEKLALEEKQKPDEMVQKAIESIMDGIELLDTITALKQQ